MSVEKISGYRNPPTLEDFSPIEDLPKVALGSLEHDLKVMQYKNAQKKRHQDSLGSFNDLPQILPNNSHGSSERVSLSASTAGIYDWFTTSASKFYNYIWGSAIEESPGMPVSGTPKLASPAQMNLSTASAQRLIKVMDEMHQMLERLQEIKKNESNDDLSSNDNAMLFTYMQILKQQTELKKLHRTIESEAIHSLHNETNIDHKKRQGLLESLEESSKYATLSGQINTGSNVLLGAMVFFQVLELAGAFSNPALALGARFAHMSLATKMAVSAASGVTKLGKTKFENDSLNHQNSIQTLDFKRKNRDMQAKDHSHSIKTVHQSMSSVDTMAAEAINSLHRVKKALSNFN